MNKRLVSIVAGILFIAAAASVSAQNVDTKIIGFESAVVYNYNVDSQDFNYANTFGINLTLTDSLVAGFVITTVGGAADSTMLTFSYGIADKYGMNFAVGSDTAANLVGVGMYYNIFERKVQDALVSVLKLKVGYNFAPSTGIETGNVVMGLGLVLGM